MMAAKKRPAVIVPSAFTVPARWSPARCKRAAAELAAACARIDSLPRTAPRAWVESAAGGAALRLAGVPEGASRAATVEMLAVACGRCAAAATHRARARRRAAQSVPARSEP